MSTDFTTEKEGFSYELNSNLKMQIENACRVQSRRGDERGEFMAG